jgi:hypothetical protein
MTPSQLQYQSNQIAKQNAESNKRQADAAMMQASTARAREEREGRRSFFGDLLGIFRR